MNNQELLLAKYTELAEMYQAPVPEPEARDLISVRRWYRNEVMQLHNLFGIFVTLDQLIKDLGETNEFLDPLKQQAKEQQRRLDHIALTLDLTPTEWPE
jgi:hypothetical protein